MTLWKAVREWLDRPAQNLVYVAFDQEHIKAADFDPAPLEAGAHYFRLWLKEMYLKRDRTWFQDWYPAVHSIVRLQFGTIEVEIPYVAGAASFRDLNATNLNRVVGLNYPVTTLIPFNGGVVEIVAGLLAMKGSNEVERFLKVMGDFAALLTGPQLSATLAIVGPVASGILELLNSSNGGLAIGLHQAFTGRGGDLDNRLRAGYFSVIAAEESEVSPGQLWVVGDRLRVGISATESQPLSGYSYMLFGIESRRDRDDWNSLQSIAQPFDQALETLGAGERQAAESYLRSAIIAAYRSPDLTKADRRRVTQALKDEFESAVAQGLGAVAGPTPTLTDVMERAIPLDQALALGEPSLEELFS